VAAPGRALRSRVPAAVLVVGVVVTTVALFVAHPDALVTLLPSPDMRELHVDFDTFWHSAVALVHGEDIYRTPAKLTNLNPPLLTALLTPFAGLGSLPAYRIFAVLTLLMVVGAVLAVARELRLGRGWTAVTVLALLASSPLHGTLVLGQIYGLLLVALAAGWVAEHRGRPVLAAALYGIAVALKPSLAPLLLLPLVQRRWPSLGAGFASAAVATLLGVLVAGIGSGPEWLRIGFAEPVPDVVDNAALPGVAVRLGLPSAVGSVTGALLLVGTLAFLGLRSRRGAGVDPAGTAPWAVVAAGLLTAPIAWHNYLLLLWPGVLVLVAQGARRPTLRSTAAVLLALPLIPVSWGALWTDDDPWSPVGRSLYCAILLGYWAAFLVAAGWSAAGRGSPGSPIRDTVTAPSGGPDSTEAAAPAAERGAATSPTH
jgi:arabinofuranan 3-O-arabinosyltransferase